MLKISVSDPVSKIKTRSHLSLDYSHLQSLLKLLDHLFYGNFPLFALQRISISTAGGEGGITLYPLKRAIQILVINQQLMWLIQ